MTRVPSPSSIESGNAKRTSLYDVIDLFGDIVTDASEMPGPAGETEIAQALGRVLTEVDEIAVATLKSISLATLLKSLPRPEERRFAFSQ